MSRERNTIKSGSKFFRYLDPKGPPEIVRIIRISDEGKTAKIKHQDGKTEVVDIKWLKSNYRMLKADGMISVCLVKVDDKVDVLVTLCNLHLGYDVNVVCRQLISDVFTNNMRKSDGIEYVGLSVSRETCPADVDFNLTLSCSGIIESVFLAVYMDDTLDDILSLFNKKKFDDALRELAKENRSKLTNKVISGYCSSIRELLKENYFMYDFHRTFDIYEVPFKPDMETESLPPADISLLFSLLHKNITATYVMEYSREIDTSKFKREWCLVTAHEEDYSKLYIVGYDID